MSENNNVEVENNDATEAEVAPSRTLWSDAWKRLKKNNFKHLIFHNISLYYII